MVLLFWCIYIYNCYIFFLDWSIGHYVVSFFVSFHRLYFKIYFIWYEYCYSCFLLVSICVKYLFLAIHFQSVCIPCFNKMYIKVKYQWLLMICLASPFSFFQGPLQCYSLWSLLLTLPWEFPLHKFAPIMCLSDQSNERPWSIGSASFVCLFLALAHVPFPIATIFALVHITEGFILRCKWSIRMWLDTQALCVQQMEPLSRESHRQFVTFQNANKWYPENLLLSLGLQRHFFTLQLCYLSAHLYPSFSVNYLKQSLSDFSWNWDIKTRKPYYY